MPALGRFLVKSVHKMATKKSNSSRNKSTKAKRFSRFNPIQALAVIAVFSFIGAIFIYQSQAAKPPNMQQLAAKFHCRWYLIPLVNLHPYDSGGCARMLNHILKYYANAPTIKVTNTYGDRKLKQKNDPAIKAVKTIQTFVGIPATGGVGPKTWQVIQAVYLKATGQLKSVTPGPVFVVGDSIGTQFAPNLAKVLNNGSGGWSVSSNVVPSRNLSGTPPSPDGFGAIDANAAAVRGAHAIVVELGTNTGGLNTGNIDAMVNKIRSYNSSARIFWVNTAVVNRPSYTAALDNVNRYIASQSNAKNYEIVDWSRTVFGENVDPTNMPTSGGDSNGFISQADGLNVHLTSNGTLAYAAMVANSIKN
jgi:hypothetical protein